MAGSARYEPQFRPSGDGNYRLLQMASQNPLEDQLTKLEAVGERAGMQNAQDQATNDVMAGGTPGEKIPLTPAALAYNSALHDAYAARTETQIKAKVADLSSQFTGRNPTDPQNFAQVFDANMEAIAGSVPEEMRGKIQLEIQARRAEALGNITQRAQEHQFQLNAQAIKVGIDSDIEEAATRARLLHSPEKPGVLLGRAFERIDRGVASGLWNEEQAGLMKQDAQYKVQAENIFGTAAARGNLESTYAGVVSGTVAPELPVDVRDRLAGKLSAEIGHRNSQAAEGRAAAEAAMRKNTYIAKTIVEANKVGAVLTPDQEQFQSQVQKGQIEIDPSVLDDLNVASTIPHVGAAITSLPVAQADAYAQNFAPPKPPPTQAEIDALKTKVPPGAEADYAAWFEKYGNHDSGRNYDYAGAWMDGVTPNENGHWPDTYKLPNHPTFSTDSRLAKQFPDMAGTWKGEQYTPNPQRQFDAVHARVWDMVKDTAAKWRAGLTGNDPTQTLLDYGKLTDRVDGPAPPIDFSDEQKAIAAVQIRAERLNRADSQYKQTFPLLTKSEADQLAAVLDNPEADRVGILSALASAAPQRANATFKMLGDSGHSDYALIGATAMTVGPKIAKDIDTAKVINPDVKKMVLHDPVPNGNSQIMAYEKAVGGLFANEEAKNAHMDATEKLYVTRAARDGVTSFNAKMYQQAASDLVGGVVTLHTGGFMSGYSSKLPGLSGVTQRWLDGIDGDAIARAGGTSLRDADATHENIARQIRDSGRFVYTPQGLKVEISWHGQRGFLMAPDGKTPFLLQGDKK